MNEYLKATIVFSSIVEDLIKVKNLKDFDRNKLESVLKDLESVDISINYRNSLLAFMKES